MKNIHGRSMNLIKIRNSFMMLTEGTQFLTRTLTCNQCKLTFLETKELKLHMKKVHSKFTCLPCNKSFAQKCRLTEHTSRIHSNRLFICQFCTKRFTCLDTLKYHKKNGCKGVHKKSGDSEKSRIRSSVNKITETLSSFSNQSQKLFLKQLLKKNPDILEKTHDHYL